MRLSKKDNLPPPEPIPIDVRPSWIQDMPELEDVKMEEKWLSIIGQNPETARPESTEERRQSARQPLIQQCYDSEGLMRTVLSAPVTIPIGEFMAYSAELRKQLMRELQNHTMKFTDNRKPETGNKSPSIAQVNLVTMEPI